MQQRIRRRYGAERRFRYLGLGAVLLSAAFLAFLLITMLGNGIRGFTQTEVRLDVDFPKSALFLDPATLKGFGAEAALAGADIDGAVRTAAQAQYGDAGAGMLSDTAWLRVRDAIRNDPSILSRQTTLWLPAASALDTAAKSEAAPVAERSNRFSKQGCGEDRPQLEFPHRFRCHRRSGGRHLGSIQGSLLTMLVTLASPFRSASSRPSISRICAAKPLDRHDRGVDQQSRGRPVHHLRSAGLAVFLNFMNLPRSAPLVGGLTLALMTMPVIVIAGRNAIKSVPPSIRDAALGIGASRIQVVFHHVLPLALPGILTGTIIGMARALGETAPLLMIGMRAFIASPPAA
jgi:phosphate transport system permease protein